MDILDERQKQELEKLNKALESNNIQPEDKKLLRRKMYNPQTGELQLFVEDEKRGGVKLTSVNLLGD